jgi:hypothetical protein
MTPQPITIGERAGLVTYVNARWMPVVAEEATLAVVVFDDGGRGYYAIETSPRTAGGPGSGNFGHGGRPGEVGGSGGAGGTSEKIGTPATRTARALATHKPSTQEKQALADKSEHEIAEVIGGTRTDDNDPFDTVVKTPGHMHGVEVKTLIDNTNDKITMHPDARERKIAWGRRNHAAMHTVVVDMRTSQTQYYYRRGVGSFRISAMKAVSRSEISGLIRK